MITIGSLRMDLVKMQSAWNQNAPVVFNWAGVKYRVSDFYYKDGELWLQNVVMPDKWRIEKTFIRSDATEYAPLQQTVFESPDEAVLACVQNIYAEVGNQEGDIRNKVAEIVSAIQSRMSYSFANVIWRITED